MRKPHKQRGVALITAILIVTFASIAAVGVTSRSNLDISRVENILRADQALQYAYSGEVFINKLLELAFSLAADPRVDEPTQWQTPHNPIPIPEGFINLRIKDAQGCFNLNSLNTTTVNNDTNNNNSTTTETPATIFQRLLSLIQTNTTDPNLAETVTSAAIDWIDTDDNPTGAFGAEDNQYLLRQIPYRTPDQLFNSPSELRLLNGLNNPQNGEAYARLLNVNAQSQYWQLPAADTTADTYRPFAPFVCVLPADNTPININTAPLAVIAALHPKLQSAGLDTIGRQLEKRIFKKPDDIQQLLKDLLLSDDEVAEVLPKLSISSDYFLIEARVTIGNTTVNMHSLFHRNPTTGKARVVARSKGTF